MQYCQYSDNIASYHVFLNAYSYVCSYETIHTFKVIKLILHNMNLTTTHNDRIKQQTQHISCLTVTVATYFVGETESK